MVVAHDVSKADRTGLNGSQSSNVTQAKTFAAAVFACDLFGVQKVPLS